MTNETKIYLATALKRCMSKKPLEKVTIQELTNVAGVNRQTFYYHFTDIYDLLSWTLKNEASVHLQNKHLEELWQDGVLKLFHYLEENRDFALCAIHSLGHNHMNRFFYTAIHENVTDIVYTLSQEIPSEKDHLNFLIHYYTLSFSAIAISWLEGEIDDTPEGIITKIDATITDQIVGAKHRFKE